MTQDITWNKMIIGILETTWQKKSVVENFELKFKLKDRKSVLFMRMLFYHPYWLQLNAEQFYIKDVEHKIKSQSRVYLEWWHSWHISEIRMLGYLHFQPTRNN